MKHSVLMTVGDNLIYQCAPDQKPPLGNPELMKDFAFWQQTVKNYLIKTEDRSEFAPYMSEDTSRGEVAIPYELVEIYFDVRNNRNYARMSKGVKVDEKTQKVVTMSKVCKVCDEIQDVPVEKVAEYFPICNSCLKSINELIKNKQ